MGPLRKVIPLSGQLQGNIFAGIAAEAGRTTLHTIPAGEIHRVNIEGMNAHSTTAIRVVGDFTGGASDQTYDIDLNIAARTTTPILRGFTAAGPCVIKLAAIANQTSMNVYGSAEVYQANP